MTNDDSFLAASQPYKAPLVLNVKSDATLAALPGLKHKFQNKVATVRTQIGQKKIQRLIINNRPQTQGQSRKHRQIKESRQFMTEN